MRTKLTKKSDVKAGATTSPTMAATWTTRSAVKTLRDPSSGAARAAVTLALQTNRKAAMPTPLQAGRR